MDLSTTKRKDNERLTNTQVPRILNEFISFNPPPVAYLIPSDQIKREANGKSEGPKIPRPANAFMLFANENRKKVSKMFPQDSNKDISCRLGKQWKNLKSNDKDKYYVMAKKVDAEHKRKYPSEFWDRYKLKRLLTIVFFIVATGFNLYGHHQA